MLLYYLCNYKNINKATKGAFKYEIIKEWGGGL